VIDNQLVIDDAQLLALGSRPNLVFVTEQTSGSLDGKIHSITVEATLGYATASKTIEVTIKNPCLDATFAEIAVENEVLDINHTLFTPSYQSWTPFTSEASAEVLAMCGGISYLVTMKSDLDAKAGALDDYLTVDYDTRTISLNVNDRITLKSNSYHYTVKGYYGNFPEGPVFAESTGAVILNDVCNSPDSVTAAVNDREVEASYAGHSAFEFPEVTVVPDLCDRAALYSCEITGVPQDYYGDEDLCSFHDEEGNSAMFDENTGLHTFNAVVMDTFPQGVYTFKLSVKIGDKTAEVHHEVLLI
jgi:hypothetical protein